MSPFDSDQDEGVGTVFPSPRTPFRSDLLDEVARQLPRYQSQVPFRRVPGGTVPEFNLRSHAAAETWNFQPYFVTDSGGVKQLRIREGLVSPGSIVPTLDGTRLDDATPPEISGKDTGTHVAWLQIEATPNTEAFYDDFSESTKYRFKSGLSSVDAAVVLFSTDAQTEPAGARAPTLNDSTGSITQTAKFNIQINVITGEIPQTRLIANLNRSFQIDYCPNSKFLIRPMSS